MSLSIKMVPEAGLEPAHPLRRGILTFIQRIFRWWVDYIITLKFSGAGRCFTRPLTPSYFLLLSHFAIAQVVVEPSVSDGSAADCLIYYVDLDFPAVHPVFLTTNYSAGGLSFLKTLAFANPLCLPISPLWQ